MENLVPQVVEATLARGIVHQLVRQLVQVLVQVDVAQIV